MDGRCILAVGYVLLLSVLKPKLTQISWWKHVLFAETTRWNHVLNANLIPLLMEMMIA